MIERLALIAILSAFFLSTCAPLDRSEAKISDTQVVSTRVGEMITHLPDMIVLPTPRLKGDITLEEALLRRRSVREFTEEDITLDELAQLLWAAQGITNPAGYRTAPSAGALYPLEVYAASHEGVYHYDPAGHRLKIHLQGDVRPPLYAAALRQEPLLNAPVVFVITAIYERTEIKYGRERGPRYVHLEAGHAAQNLLLQAVALDLAAVPIGAFQDDQVKQVLSLPADHQPLYLIPVGHPK
jgi:SagB-type dehydrogenase family enzyme